MLKLQFSIRRAVFVAPAHFTELMIYGKRGIDMRCRLALWRALKRKGLPEEQMKNALLNALPLGLGEWFSVGAGLVTMIAGFSFIWLASRPVREFTLQIHRLTNGPSDYVLLMIQWIGFYLAMSLAGSCLTSIIALAVYASRIARYM